jgi:hypothetical protein
MKKGKQSMSKKGKYGTKKVTEDKENNNGRK